MAIARAVGHAPSLIRADEPTGNLDQATGGEIAALMFELTRANNASLLLVTHDPDLAETCDRALRIENGIIHG